MGEWRERKQRGIRESGFPRQAFNLNGKLNLDPRAFSFFLLFSSRGDQQHSRERQTDETFQGEKQGGEEKNRDNQRRGSSFKFSALFTFKNGSFMMNSFPGYPLVKIFNLLINMFKPRRKPEIENWQNLESNGSLRREMIAFRKHRRRFIVFVAYVHFANCISHIDWKINRTVVIIEFGSLRTRTRTSRTTSETERANGEGLEFVLLSRESREISGGWLEGGGKRARRLRYRSSLERNFFDIFRIIHRNQEIHKL